MLDHYVSSQVDGAASLLQWVAVLLMVLEANGQGAMVNTFEVSF
jgi:hypothetical protein